MNAPPKIEVYAVGWNEEKRLPFFLRHYGRFSQKIVIFDNQSTDRSHEIILSHPKAELRIYESGNQIRDDFYWAIKNKAWEESKGRADWVIVVDIDELVYHPNLPEFLMTHAEATLMCPYGYAMISEAEPSGEGLLTEISCQGVRDKSWDKPCLFRPDRLTINFDPGCHRATPRGQVGLYRHRDLKLLHYKAFGRQFYLDRIAQYATRLSEVNKSNNWGAEYQLAPERHEQWFENTLKLATKVI